MNKKILFTASTASHLKNFHLPYMKAFEEQGWDVKAEALPLSKSFFSLNNIRVIFLTKKMIRQENFDVISTHTTLAGIITRLAVLLSSRRKRPVVFYTVHGFLFHDNKGLKKWIYLIPEILCRKVTDVLMVMNHEDLAIAKKYQLCKEIKKIYYINGMGIDLTRFHPKQTSKEHREAFGIKESDFTFVYAAEFSWRKNHSLLLRSFAETLRKLDRESDSSVSGIKLALAGEGSLLEEMKVLSANLGISKHVLFLGQVSNMQDLYSCCQAAVTTSKIEGLPFNVMEALCCGIPVVASDIKGHQELVTHGKNGLLYESDNMEQLASQLQEVFTNDKIRSYCKMEALERMKPFSIENVLPHIMNIYSENIILREGNHHVDKSENRSKR